MSSARRYSNEIYNFYQTDSLITKASIVFWITDNLTGRMVPDAIKVSIPENKRLAYRNLSGYFIFTDLCDGVYSVMIESELFFSVSKQIDTSSIDPKNPVVSVQLIPKPSYPFPENSTLIRGLVNSITGPVDNALIKVIGKQFETITDERGEFVLYFKNIKHEQIQINIEKGGDTKIITAGIFEGKTFSTGVITFP